MGSTGRKSLNYGLRFHRKQLVLTRVVSGLSHLGQRTNLRMNPSKRSCSLTALCAPLTM